MLVDDSAIIRGLVSRALKEAEDIEIAGTATNGEQAVALIDSFKPDVVVLDIEMPVMDGMTALPLLLEKAPETHVIMASTLTQRNAEMSLRALSLGASDYLTKPSARDGQAGEQFFRDMRDKIRSLAQVKPNRGSLAPAPAPAAPTIMQAAAETDVRHAPVRHVEAIAIASSTGGPQALQQLFTQLKNRAVRVPVFITQHMPPTFTAILADHIGKAAGVPSHEARDGERVMPGHIYLAPGDYHMQPEKTADGVVIRLNRNPPENFCRPAADPMLRNLSQIYGDTLLVAVLTGMGQDGLAGARAVVEKGGEVIAQDQASSVVWGMPRAVTEARLVTQSLGLDALAEYLARAVTR